MPIPKIIHQIWVSGNPIPNKYKRLMQTWKDCNPDYKQMVWELNNLELDRYSKTSKHILTSDVHYEVKMDVLTWEVLCLYGGIKADVDTKCQKSFDCFLGLNCFSGSHTRRTKSKEVPYIRELPNGVRVVQNNAVVGMEKDSLLSECCSNEINMQVLRHIKILRKRCEWKYCERPCYPFLQEGRILSPIYFNPFSCDELWRAKEEFPDSYSVHYWGGCEPNGWVESSGGHIPKSWKVEK
jgi:hypothetical protein